jgi:hypothetical protein
MGREVDGRHCRAPDHAVPQVPMMGLLKGGERSVHVAQEPGALGQRHQIVGLDVAAGSHRQEVVARLH